MMVNKDNGFLGCLEALHTEENLMSIGGEGGGGVKSMIVINDNTEMKIRISVGTFCTTLSKYMKMQ